MPPKKSSSIHKKHGGKRPGAGRPKKSPTKVFSQRVDGELLDKAKAKNPDLKEKFLTWLRSLV